MRKRLLGALAALAGLVLAACGRPEATPGSVHGQEDVLFVRTSEGITLLPAVPEGIAVRVPSAVPAMDWSAVVQADLRKRVTRIEAFATPSGESLWSRDVGGNLEVKAASPYAHLVALGSPGDASGYPAGRSTTTLVIVADNASEPRTIELEGNYEPEAFSIDGESLFVIEYLPPRDPTQYRVRRLDLRTEEVVGVYSVDAELQEAMQGTARVQAASADGRRLYTLYTIKAADGMTHAFVHVLSLDELWAHCVDLPSTFGTAREKEIALSVSEDDSRLYASDASSGTVAEVDTEALMVTRTTSTGFGSQAGVAHAVVGPDGTVYLGKGTQLVALNGSSLEPAGSWDLEGKITGIQAANDGRRLYVGLKDQIVILDTASDEPIGVLDPADLGTIDQLGQETFPLDQERTETECAC